MVQQPGPDISELWGRRESSSHGDFCLNLNDKRANSPKQTFIRDDQRQNTLETVQILTDSDLLPWLPRKMLRISLLFF